MGKRQRKSRSVVECGGKRKRHTAVCGALDSQRPLTEKLKTSTMLLGNLASLQSTLNDAAKAQGIRLSSTRALDAGEQGSVRLLGLQTQLSTELVPLQALLFDLEKKRPNLMIDGLHIMRAPDTGSGRPPGLDVTFTLLGASPEKKD